MSSPYRSPWWLPGGHAQTIYAAALGRLRPAQSRGPALRRVRWDTPDGDFIDVDLLDAPAGSSADTPMVVMFHGLEGSSRSHYARAMMRALAARGWRGALPHFRGCSGEPNRLPRAYHSGDSAEIGFLLSQLHALAAASQAPLYACGVSLGGNALLKWLGEQRGAARDLVAACAAVSPPLDLAAAGDHLARGGNRIYTRMFLATMKHKSGAKLARFPGLFDAGAMQRARNLREFDDVVTAPLHGFRDVDDYWTRASAKPWLAAIEVPTLLLSARNDPFLPERALPGPSQVSAAVQLELLPHGGHVGFVSGGFPGHLDWLPSRLLSFFDSQRG